MNKQLLSSFVIIVLFAAGAQGQSLYNNGFVVSIGSSGVLFVKDSIINEGTIVNNGDMQVGGSWINNGQYDAGAGQITFSSPGQQVINHNDQSFGRLVISGGGQKLFMANITIENELDLQDGILVSGNDSRIIFSPEAHISGGSDASHINGPVYHLGEGTKVYPLGNGSAYLPVTLLNVEGADAEVGIEEHELEGTALSMTATIRAISDKRYWQLDVAAGSVRNSQVILPVRDETLPVNDGELVVAQASAPDANFESLGQSQVEGSASAGFVTSNRTVEQPFLTVGIAATDEDIEVYNAISPNGDDQNEFLYIGNIESYPENTFTLYNRWGDRVFYLENYNNKDRVFRGRSNVNGEKQLVTGTYYYVIKTKKDNRKIDGFLMVKY